MPDFFNPDPAWVHIEDAGGSEVDLVFSGTWMKNIEREEFALRFPSAEDLGTWLDGPVVRAVQGYRRRVQNTPAKVIERALAGTYRDYATQAEMILEDLRSAGHVVIDANIKSSSARGFLANAARQGKIQVLPEDDDLMEKKSWVHPKTGLRWLLDEWRMRDGLGDIWQWAGGWESDKTGYMWPILSRDLPIVSPDHRQIVDVQTVDVRWDHVEANGWLSVTS